MRYGARVTQAGVPRQHANASIGTMRSLPGQAQAGAGGLAGGELVVKRRQRFPGFELTEIDALRNSKRLDTPVRTPFSDRFLVWSVSTKHIAQFVVPRSIPTTNREAVSNSLFDD